MCACPRRMQVISLRVCKNRKWCVHAPAVCRLSRCASAITGGDELGGLTRVKPFKYSYEKVRAEAVRAQPEKVRAEAVQVQLKKMRAEAAQAPQCKGVCWSCLCTARKGACLPSSNCIVCTHTTLCVRWITATYKCMLARTQLHHTHARHPSCGTSVVSRVLCHARHPSCVTPRVSRTSPLEWRECTIVVS